MSNRSETITACTLDLDLYAELDGLVDALEEVF